MLTRKARSGASVRRPPLALDLLVAAARRSAPGTRAIALERYHVAEIRWVLEAGLGALLYRLLLQGGGAVPAPWRDALLSADLTAQVLHGNRVDTVLEVADLCAPLGIAVTLLKGIGIAEQHYPLPHLRPMSDVDLLVPPASHDAVVAALRARGYVPLEGYEAPPGAKHDAPLAHPARGVWVEVHRRLFDDSTAQGPFGPQHVAAETVACRFHGRDLLRLTERMQLLYLAFGWSSELASYGASIHPSRLPAMLDAVYLLDATRGAFECGPFVHGPDGDMALASLYVLASYLMRRGVVPCQGEMLDALRARQRIVGRFQLAVLHRVLDRYLLGARRWHGYYPMPVPGRYKLSHQLRKRLGTLRTLAAEAAS